MTATSPSRNGAIPSAPPPWIRQSVRQFFAAVSWEGAQLRQINVQASSPSAPLRLSISVQAFFDSFPWEGNPEIAMPVSTISLAPEAAVEDDSLTLDDFSALF